MSGRGDTIGLRAYGYDRKSIPAGELQAPSREDQAALESAKSVYR